MVNISVEYTGDLHCDAVHGPSHARIATDAPTDNKGKGESFSPTDLVATALGTCMSTILAMAAQEHGLDVKGMTVSVSKEMSKDAPRRIVGLPSEVHIPLPAIRRSARYSRAPRSIAQCTRAFRLRSNVRRNSSGKVEYDRGVRASISQHGDQESDGGGYPPTASADARTGRV